MMENKDRQIDELQYQNAELSRMVDQMAQDITSLRHQSEVL